jgi:membrane-associated phospholipid phosphatase
VIGWIRRRRVHLSARRFIVADLALFAALLAAVKANASTAFDLAFTLRVQGAKSPWLDETLHAVSWPGFPPQSRIIPPIVIGLWWAAGKRVAAAFQLLGWATAFLSTLVKAVIRRPRPLPPQVKVVVAPLGGTSFPSGHVLTYVGFYGTLAYLLAVELGDSAFRTVAVSFLAGLVGMVGPSRIQQGHHWPTDVLASYLLGSAYLLALIELHERVSEAKNPIGFLRDRPLPGLPR